MDFPDICVIDTNVAILANGRLSDTPSDIPDECIDTCIKAINHIRDKKGLVLDDDGEIFNEYINNLSLKGAKGVGSAFLKWVNDNQYSSLSSQRVKITKNNDSYLQFPNHPELVNFDISDRKFVAVANAHPNKPAILQATDCKWVGWEKPLTEVGITVIFLCKEYTEQKYKKKITSKMKNKTGKHP